jgi:hypothetical protein
VIPSRDVATPNQEDPIITRVQNDNSAVDQRNDVRRLIEFNCAGRSAICRQCRLSMTVEGLQCARRRHVPDFVAAGVCHIPPAASALMLMGELKVPSSATGLSWHVPV